MASSNTNKNAMYWILLPVGVIVILAAVFMVGKVLGGRMTKPAAPPTGQAGAKVILEDQPGADQQRADRITLGESAAPAADDEADRDADKKKEDDKKTEEKTKAEISSEAATDASAAGANDTTQKTKAIITTEPDTSAAGVTAVETVPAGGASKSIYRLQLGAFESEEKAKKVADEARTETGLTVIIGKKTVGDKTLYRLQCGAFTDKEKAQSYARELELKGLSVYVSEEQR